MVPLDIIHRHETDAVVLGCMRLPLILRDGVGGVRFIDTLALHIADIFKHAVSEK
jgi:aspartate/glutamate racemase